MSSIVPPPSTPLRLYAVVTLAGALVMALEIVSSRILAPTFGNSVYVWGSIISTFLAALAAGYVLGGRAADRAPHLPVLGGILVLAAAWIALVLLVGQPIVRRIGDAIDRQSWGPLLATALLFGPPTVALATVSPFAVRLSARDLPSLGNLSGRLYALSTAGSLAGTLGATFVLIPFLGLRTIFGALLLANLACVWLAIGPHWRRHLAASTATLVLLAAAPWLVTRARPAGGPLAIRVTPYQTLEVTEVGTLRELRADGHIQSAIDLATGEPALDYPRWAIAAWLFNDDIRSAALLGLGGGSVGTYLQSRFDALSVDYVEIDPAVADVASAYLGFTTSPRRRLHTDDGRSFLARSATQFDLVYCDMYIGYSVPFHTTTVEFFTLARRRLAERGVLMINVAATVDRPFSRAVLASVARVFPHLYVFQVTGRGNTVVLAHDGAVRVGRDELLARAAALDQRYGFAPGFAAVAQGLHRGELLIRPQDALTDAFAPTDRLLHLERRELGIERPQ